MSTKLNINNTSGFMVQNKLDGIFEYLKNIGSTNKIYLCVSGGSDSMLLAHLVLKYYKDTKLDTKNICILHYNHHQRSTSTQDELFVRTWCVDNDIPFVGASFWGQKDETENVLRKARWDFFHTVIRQSTNPILLTGHHLDDRIETSILNLHRGCHQKGFYNMSTTKECLYRDDFGNILHYVYIRPLLETPKETIQYLCKELDIGYTIDETNMDINISLRNKIRGYLKKTTTDYHTLFGFLYTKNLPGSNIKYTKLTNFNPEIQEYYHIGGVGAIQDVVELLDFVGAYTNISQGYLQELLEFIYIGNGTKKIKNWRLIKAHRRLYLILASEQFRSRLKTNTLVGKKYKGKSLSKRYINQKIPFFLRQELDLEMKKGAPQPQYHREMVKKGWLV